MTEKPSNILTVSELTRRIKGLLSANFNDIWIEGELSNFKHHSSGHMYFSLKDEKSVLAGCFFKFANQHLKFIPADGMKVVVHGNIDVYDARGNYQIIIDAMEPLGTGALQLKFEQLKKKLTAEGLFEEARKRPIPKFPERIAIVTSPTGAVIKDIMSVFHRRDAGVYALIYPVRVQGEGAAQEIAGAINEINETGGFDVLIVARGGGSLEDLWAFNEEVVARAIFGSKIPVISGVGHMTDYTISDFTADMRTATPTAAAEAVVKDKKDIIDLLDAYEMRMKQELKRQFGGFKEKIEALRKTGLVSALKRTLEIYKERVAGLKKSPVFVRPKDRLNELRQQIDDIEESMGKSYKHLMEMKKKNLENLGGKLEMLNPLHILNRGYSIVTKKTDGSIVKDSSKLKKDDEIEVKFSKGIAKGKILESEK